MAFLCTMSTDQIRERIRAKMEAKKLTYRDIADKCGVSPSMVFHFMKGRGVHSGTLDKLKKA